ncbi:CBO0543 family protein [Bacillus methanolicus]|uniref:CBO0543 family protein n=1 Tax=Bacillus methanolicus TaxID=1471 RepID=UPI00025F2092|nr:CBO0543 family protein [Bacillus methanolicus]EIJ82937.1 group-specific protein [Bacillus methanolicus MGA3]
MITAKHSKNLNLPHLPKKRSLYNKLLSYFPSIVFASWAGTYLDLYFVGKNLYEFPVRPLSEIFSINIAFTLIGLPIITAIFLFFAKRIEGWRRWGLMIVGSAVASMGERLSEYSGFFLHTEEWNHSYSFFGYLLFLVMIWNVFKWTNIGLSKKMS